MKWFVHYSVPPSTIDLLLLIHHIRMCVWGGVSFEKSVRLLRLLLHVYITINSALFLYSISKLTIDITKFISNSIKQTLVLEILSSFSTQASNTTVLLIVTWSAGITTSWPRTQSLSVSSKQLSYSYTRVESTVLLAT